ncbi:MAG: hypothetical protein GVY36_12695 [Verrucomicrobia bacterium]|jgi:hypothetical protein|nr:hypothetical protein [Verrucomicrobiota bacterium]
MPVLDPKCFDINHLQQMQALTRASDLLMLERCTLALELVGRLRQHGLDFIFKGGTSLLLQLPEPRRLSIDVDILCNEAGKLPEVLDKVCAQAPFTGWVYQEHRERDEPPTKHYAVYFDSVVGTADADWMVLIDVIDSEDPYARLEEKELKASFVTPVESVSLKMPSLSSMLGDKLAAFAPGTIGYPYRPMNRRGEPDEPRPANVVKHLHDLGQLAASADNLAEAIKSYRNIHAEQCKWRGDHAFEACLEDSQAAAILASKVEALKLKADDPQVDFFRRGISSVNSHMFSELFGREAVRTAGGRAALVAEIIRREQTGFPLAQTLAAAPDIAALKKTKLEGPWESVDILRKTDIQAYALWEQAQRLRSGELLT